MNRCTLRQVRQYYITSLRFATWTQPASETNTEPLRPRVTIRAPYEAFIVEENRPVAKATAKKVKKPIQNAFSNTFGTLSEGENIEQQYNKYDYRKSSGKIVQEKYEDEENYPEYSSFDGPKEDWTWYEDRCVQLAQEGKLVECVAMFEKRMLQEDCVTPSWHNFRAVLNALQVDGHIVKAYQLFELMREEYGIQPNAYAYTLTLRACANASEPKVGLKYAERLIFLKDEMEHPIFTQTHYNLLIRIYGKTGDISGAIRMLRRMEQEDIKPTSNTFSQLMHACANHPDGFRKAIKLWKLQQEMGVVPHPSTYLLLLLAVRDGKQTSQDQDETVVEEKKKEPLQIVATSANVEKKFISNDSDPVWSHISPAIRQEIIPVPIDLSTREARFALIGGPEGILASMKRHGLKADNRHYGKMLDLLPNTHEHETHLLNVMQSEGQAPDAGFLTLILKRKKFRRELEFTDVMTLMQKHKITPNENMFGAMAIVCYGRNEGLKLLSDMEAMGFIPNELILQGLMFRALIKLDFYFALEVLEAFEKYQIKPLQKTINSFERLLLRAHRIIHGPNFQDKDRSRKFGVYPFKNQKPDKKTTSIFFNDYKKFWNRYEDWLRNTEMNPNKRPWRQLADDLENFDTNKLREQRTYKKYPDRF